MSKFDRLFPFMNEFEQHITDLYTLEKIIDATANAIEALEVDRSLNLLIGLKEMLKYNSDLLHDDFTRTWKEFMTPLHTKKSFYTKIDEDGVLTIPEDIMDELGWEEGDLLDLKVADDGTITITMSQKADNEGVGCMGDILTDKELEILKKDGIMGLEAPWDNA